jgi:hypothetical protein
MNKLPEHYTSIDYLPMLNWDKINKKNDLSHLLLKPEKINSDQALELQKVWEVIQNEYIEVFGLGDFLTDVVNLEMKIARLKLKKIIKDDASINNFIKANEKLLTELKNKSVAGDLYETKQAIEKHFGFRISLIDCTVREFYGYLKDLKK